MNKFFKNLFFAVVFCPSIYLGSVQEPAAQNEFVVTRAKSKKESASSVKEDIAITLEMCHQQISKNIIELAKIQQQTFDKIKDLVGVCDASSNEKSVFDGSTVQLKEQRHKLKAFHHKLVQQQEELQHFLACF